MIDHLNYHIESYIGKVLVEYELSSCIYDSICPKDRDGKGKDERRKMKEERRI